MVNRLNISIHNASKQVFYECSDNAFSAAAEFTWEHFPRHRLAVVIDSNVLRLYGTDLTQVFVQHPKFSAERSIIAVPAGEASKSRTEKDRIEDELFARGFGRDTVLVAVGGGVVGDVAGYVAATFNRGVPLVHVPTTLLAQVDSSIGGKTGINHAAGKNLIGAFYQPEAVFASVDALATLSDVEFRSGLAEVIKYAATLDMGLWDMLEQRADLVNARERSVLQEIIVRSAAIKIRVVEQDEKESGLRAILNFGHTTAHAFESLSAYSIPHGFAVAAGMRVAMRLSRDVLGYPDEYVQRFDALLACYKLNLEYGSRFQHDEVWAATLADKKSREGTPRFVLMKTPTEYVLAHPVERPSFLAALASV
jgi:3-dehydroquinate synthase